jgi:hypothetical protein
VLEIDVDVGGFLALLADETLEEHFVLVGVDGGDAEAVADGRVGGGAAALAEDILRAGEFHEVVHGEKEGVVVELLDEVELVVEPAADFFGDAAGVLLAGVLPGEAAEIGHRRFARRGELFGVFVAELVEEEVAAIGDFNGALDGAGEIVIDLAELLERAEVAFSVRKSAVAELGDGRAVANGGEDVLQREARGRVVVDVAGGDEGKTSFAREAEEAFAMAVVGGAVVEFGEEVGAVTEEVAVDVEDF